MKPVMLCTPALAIAALTAGTAQARDNIQIAKGVNTGEMVVTAGVQTLRPGQKVKLLGAKS